jgi:hypothetical protein
MWEVVPRATTTYRVAHPREKKIKDGFFFPPFFSNFASTQPQILSLSLYLHEQPYMIASEWMLYGNDLKAIVPSTDLKNEEIRKRMAL